MDRTRLFLLAVVFMLVASCQTQTAVVSSSEKEGDTTVASSMQDTPGLEDADSAGRFGPTPEDSIQCVANWNLYNEFFRQRDYERAYGPWRAMLEDCPRATLNIYIHGPGILRYFHQQAQTEEEQMAWVDTLMTVYDKRIKYFGNRGEVLGRKAVGLYQIEPDRVGELITITEEAIELMGDGIDPTVLLIHFGAIAREFNAGLRDIDELLSAYAYASAVIDFHLASNPGGASNYERTGNNLRQLFSPYASCDNFIRLYQPRFEESPDDPDLLKEIIATLDQAGCIDADLFYDATLRFYRHQPDAASAFLLGQLELERERFQEAISFLQESIDQYGDANESNRDTLFRAYWLMAETAYRELNRKAEARNYARLAHEMNPGDGRPLILIGEMYAASAEDCGDNEFTKKAAFWTAVDKFNEVIRFAENEAVRERARQLMEVYQQYFPHNEDIFMYGFSVGDRYEVGCWINKQTIIRAR